MLIETFFRKLCDVHRLVIKGLRTYIRKYIAPKNKNVTIQ